jgi:hypothetical protein
MKDTDVQIKFDARAVLRKWPSVNYERIGNSWPYIIAEGTLDECFGNSSPSPHLRISCIRFTPLRQAN